MIRCNMNSRDKFLSVMRMKDERYNEDIKVPKVEWGYWSDTIRRWIREGMIVREPIPSQYLEGTPIIKNS